MAKSNANVISANNSPSLMQQFQAKSKSTTRPSSPRASVISQGGNTGGERLEVTVIPVDDEPYSKIVTIPQSLIGKKS